ncbi:MAG: SDR family oxidoreductase, partial [Acidobacteriota bacterium]
VETVARDGDGIDVLFLNAGVATAAPLTETDDETFDRLVNVNFRGPWLALRAAVPHLKPGASVVINTSVSNVKGIPGFGIYAATKAAVRSLVRTAAAELSGMGIRVNAVSPGPVETPIFGKVGLTEAQVDEFQEGIATQVPLGRMGKASEIAGAVAFLASDDAAYVQGAELAVDGGMTQA